jgi:hypothetical protein
MPTDKREIVHHWNDETTTNLDAEIQVGGQDKLNVADFTTNELLGQILIELRKLNLRQEEAFEETVNDGDVSCE